MGSYGNSYVYPGADIVVVDIKINVEIENSGDLGTFLWCSVPPVINGEKKKRNVGVGTWCSHFHIV
jgi:hypothetical protein